MLFITAAWAASVTLNPGDDVASLTSALGPGDEIVFANGIYEIPATIQWSGEGTKNDPITLRANEPGRAVLEFVGESGRIAEIHNSSFITVEGLVFQGGEGWEDIRQGGLRIGNSTNITIQDCEFTQLGGTVMYLSEDNARIALTGNHIHDTHTSSMLYVGCADGTCWTSESSFTGNLVHDLAGTDDYAVILEAGSQGWDVSDNVFYNLGFRGIVTHSTELGDPIVIEGNALWSVTDLAIYVRGSSTIRNNVIFNSGSGIYAADPEWETYTDVVITHNTVVDTEGWGMRVYDWTGAMGMVLANNVVSNPTGYAFHTDEGDWDDENMISANVFSGLVQNLEPLKDHYIPGAGERDFIDAPAWDFYPSSTSTLLGSADPSAEAWVPPIDFNHAERDGAAPDVGAYERSTGDNPGWAIQEGFKVPGVDEEPISEEVGGCGCNDDSLVQNAWMIVGLLPLLGLRRRS